MGQHGKSLISSGFPVFVQLFIDHENRTTFCADVTDKNAANSRIRSFSAVNSERRQKGVIFNLIAAWRLPHEDRWGISCPSVFFYSKEGGADAEMGCSSGWHFFSGIQPCETIGNLEAAFAIYRKATKKQKLKFIALYSVAFLQEK